MNTLPLGIEFLESQNAFLFMQSMGLTLLFSVLAWNLRHDRGSLMYNAIIAILIFNAPAALRQGMFWYGRTMYPEDPLWVLKDLQGWVLVIALFITGIGAMCKIRVFSVQDYGHGPWVITATASVIAAAYAYFL